MFDNIVRVCIGLHDALRVPQDGVGVEVLGGVEPEIELLFSVTFSLREYVRVEDVWVATQVTKKLEVDFVVRRTQRRKLRTEKKFRYLIRMSYSMHIAGLIRFNQPR